MYVKLVLERKYGKQITPNDVIPETEMKIIDVDIPDIDNKEQLIKVGGISSVIANHLLLRKIK